VFLGCITTEGDFRGDHKNKRLKDIIKHESFQEEVAWAAPANVICIAYPTVLV
jgi:hypothetical protein